MCNEREVSKPRVVLPPIVDEIVTMGVKECRLDQEHNHLMVYVPQITGKSSLFPKGLGVVFKFTTPEGKTVEIPVGSTVQVVPAREE